MTPFLLKPKTVDEHATRRVWATDYQEFALLLQTRLRMHVHEIGYALARRAQQYHEFSKKPQWHVGYRVERNMAQIIL